MADTKKEEGFRSKIYKDSKGIKTVGQGFNVEDPVTASMVPKEVVEGKRDITKAENDSAYDKRMALAKSDARNYLGSDVYDKLPKAKQEVFDDMSYNMGGPSLSGFVNLKKAMVKGDHETAAKEILNSKYARDDVPARAKRNADTVRSQEPDLEDEVLRQTLPKR